MIQYANAASYWVGVGPTYITLGMITDWGAMVYGAASPVLSVLRTLPLLGVGQ